MDLYKRVIQVSEEIAGSRAKLAEKLALEARTFQGYLKEPRQKNLWPLLPQILEIYPQISRNWLYFGEGEILSNNQKSAEPPNEDTLSLQRECELLRSQLADKDKIIALYEERELDSRKNFTDVSSALGTGSAALLSHQSNEEGQ